MKRVDEGGGKRGGIAREQGERSILAGGTSSIVRVLSVRVRADRADRAVSSGMNRERERERERESALFFPIDAKRRVFPRSRRKSSRVASIGRADKGTTASSSELIFHRCPSLITPGSAISIITHSFRLPVFVLSPRARRTTHISKYRY